MRDTEDDIVAIASPPDAAARGIVRLSGPNSCEIVARLVSPPVAEHDASATCVTWDGRLRLAAPWPETPCTVLAWPTSRSYTRQPAAELHLLGCAPLLEAVVDAAITAGARPAEPGEFTLRAFLAGRLDLTQAEAVLGVIDAEDDARMHAALAQLAGGLGAPLQRLRSRLFDDLADVEAGLDFADEDLDFVDHVELAGRLADAAAAVGALVQQMTVRRRDAETARVVLFGPPNAGKSTLLNTLAQSQASLTSPQPGSTRDVVSALLEHEGRRCTLLDVAGVSGDDAAVGDSTTGGVARLAEQAARAAAEQADLVLACMPADGTTSDIEPWRRFLRSALPSHRVLPVSTKADLGRGRANGLPVSAISGDGVAELKQAIFDRLEAESRESAAEWTPGACARCRGSLTTAGEALDRARSLAFSGAGDELLAAELREAVAAIGEVTGAVYVNDVLDRVFSRFCIGK